jgi:hypothetical protein
MGTLIFLRSPSHSHSLPHEEYRFNVVIQSIPNPPWTVLTYGSTGAVAAGPEPLSFLDVGIMEMAQRLQS